MFIKAALFLKCIKHTDESVASKEIKSFRAGMIFMGKIN